MFFEKFFNIRLTFTFTGLLIASCIYSMPFMFQYLTNGIENFNESLLDASYTLGKSKIYTFFKIIIPNIKPNLISGIIMTFVHTLGEFGVVLMIGGNIPGKTKVISIAIYDKVEELNYSAAHKYSIYLVIFSFAVMLIVNSLNFKKKKTGYNND
jgi:molybdate transport system permease protein